MTQTIDLRQAEVCLAELVRKAGEGTEIVITQDGRPLARLVAAEGTLDRQPGSAKGLFVVPEDFDDPIDDLREYM